MKFKEIKPGMVIHCPKEEDARVLLEHLDGLGYRWEMTHKNLVEMTCWNIYTDETCYMIEDDKTIYYGYLPMEKGATEFSELIEPEYGIGEMIKPEDITEGRVTDEMSAVEVLEWLMTMPNETLDYVFGYDSLDEIFRNKSVNEIIDSIAEFEAAKKAPEPVEVKWVKMFRIIQIQDSGYKKCVYEEEVNPYVAYGTGEEGNFSFDPKYGAENVLKKYISEHEGRYIAVIEDVCRVKEDK